MKIYLHTLWLLLVSLALIACAPRPLPASEAGAVVQDVALYYYNPAMDMDAQGNIQCSAAGLVALKRELPADLEGVALIRATLEGLLAGELSAGEVAAGITSDFPLNGVVLEDVALQDGQLTLTFTDPGFQTSGGACRVSILHAQVEATAMQFDGVEEVRILPEEHFQP